MAAPPSFDSEKFLKLPDEKVDWLEYKRKLLTKASSLEILDLLNGTELIPEAPETEDLASLRYYDGKIQKWKSKFAKARNLLFEITDKTSKATILKQFEHDNGATIDVVKAWKAIIQYYEADTGSSDQRLHLELKLDSLSSAISDPSLRFKDLQNRLDVICTSLANLPGNQKLVLDAYSKKQKLFSAIAKDSVLNYLIKNDSVHVKTYTKFVKECERLIN